MSSQLKKLPAKAIMSTHVFMAYEGWSIQYLMRVFARNNISSAPVIASDHSLVGVVSMSDIIRFSGLSMQYHAEIASSVYEESIGFSYDKATLKEIQKNADSYCTVNKIMTHNIIKKDVSTTVFTLLETMLDKKIQRIFITDRDIIVGVVGSRDILKVLVD
ncbi:HPP family protein [Bermanella sp. R86510]|uniref:CBS domain-containing protein n=1 Tax=unclassified Bermanella TaxID=2627862 RepID=UPI0037C94D0E